MPGGRRTTTRRHPRQQRRQLLVVRHRQFVRMRRQALCRARLAVTVAMRMSHAPNVPLRPLGLFAVAALSCAVAVGARPSSGLAADPTAVTALSNETTLSRWAYPVRVLPIYADASTTARRGGELGVVTPGRPPRGY